MKTVIFDMDGLIIDSEPLWRKAEIAIFKEVNIHLTDEDCSSTAGLRIDEVVAHWYEKFPWSSPTQKEIETKIVDELIELVKAEGTPMAGIPEVFDFFKQRDFQIALASSSQYRIIYAVLDKLNIADYFDLVYSAEEEEYGKPHPGIFITTAKKLGVPPTQCLVFEDSFNGILAGLSARMKVVAVPEPMHQKNPKYNIAQVTLNSLTEWNEQHLAQLA